MTFKCIFALCLIIGFVTCNVSVRGNEESLLEKALRRDFRQYFQGGKIGRILKNVIKELDIENMFQKNDPNFELNEGKISLFCATCAAGINEILSINNTELIMQASIQLCVDLGFGTQYVCENLVYANEDDIIYIMANTPDETGNDVCGVVFVGNGCTSRNPDRVWAVTLPDVPKPPVDNTQYPDPTTVPTMKILHLADTHYDPKYTPGSSNYCEELYLCCRAESMPTNSTEVAGFWGSYGPCDIPYWTLEAMYADIAITDPDIDIVIWTGDIISHAVWNTSRETNLEILNAMADLISTYFPSALVYPAVGNHDSDPVNLFPQPYVTEPDFDISWLYDELAAIWTRWLPSEAAASIAYSAYYATQIRPGLKIVSVNTNYCYGFNWWLIHDSTDIANELLFLANELQLSEDIGEFVYIIGHIPPGHQDCQLTWSHEFNRVVARYESTISGIFFGHTHNDQFAIFFDPDDPNRPVMVGHIGQSQTTYTDTNPGYKIYTVEGDFVGSRYRPLDYNSYILNLTEANALNETNFFMLYNARTDYALPDFSPQSFVDLVVRMNETDSVYFESFYRNYNKAGTPYMVEGCDEDCKSNLLCKLVTSDNSDHSKCDLL